MGDWSLEVSWTTTGTPHFRMQQRERRNGLHWLVDFVYLLKSRNVGATVLAIGEAESVVEGEGKLARKETWRSS